MAGSSRSPHDGICLISRLLLAAVFVQHTLTEFLGYLGMLGPFPWRSAAHMTIDSLLIVVAIWLAFGIRSRVVAMLGIMLITMPYILVAHLVILPREYATMIGAVVFSIPVMLCGSGSGVLLRRGW